MTSGGNNFSYFAENQLTKFGDAGDLSPPFHRHKRRRQGDTCPPPKKKEIAKIFFGQLSCKIRSFSYAYIFRQKRLAPSPKLTELLRLCSVGLLSFPYLDLLPSPSLPLSFPSHPCPPFLFPSLRTPYVEVRPLKSSQESGGAL